MREAKRTTGNVNPFSPRLGSSKNKPLGTRASQVREAIILGKTFVEGMYKNLFKSLELEEFKPFSPVFYQKEKGDKFYIILRGEVKVCVLKSQEELNEDISNALQMVTK